MGGEYSMIEEGKYWQQGMGVRGDQRGKNVEGGGL